MIKLRVLVAGVGMVALPLAACEYLFDAEFDGYASLQADASGDFSEAAEAAIANPRDDGFGGPVDAGGGAPSEDASFDAAGESGGGTGGVTGIHDAGCSPPNLQQVERFAEQAAQGGTISQAFLNDHEGAVGKSHCSGALIGDGLFLTSNECAPELGADVTFNHQLDTAGVPRTDATYRVAETVERNATLDFAIVRLHHAPENRWGALAFEPRPAAEGEPLAFIGHPQLSDGSSYKVAGVGFVSASGADHLEVQGIGYDDRGSGAPLIARGTGGLIGVARGGGQSACEPQHVRSGTKIEAIMDHSEYLKKVQGTGYVFASANGSIGDLLWTTASSVGWRSTWRHIVVGSFGADGYDDLLFYDGGRGEIRFVAFDARGAQYEIGGVVKGLRRNWTQIVPVQLDDTELSELLFFDADLGECEFYRVDGRGGLHRVGLLNACNQDWRTIASGDFTNRSGAELVFYDPVRGAMDVQAVNADGTMVRVAENPGFGGEVDKIVVGQFVASSARDEIAVYDSVAGALSIWGFDDSGEMTRIAGYESFGTGWTEIVTGSYGAGSGTDLLAYRFSDAGAVFYSISDGALTTTARATGWRRGWRKILAGNFTPHDGSELVFYDRNR